MPGGAEEHVVARTDFETIKAADAPVKIHGHCLPVDASCLTHPLAQAASLAVPLVDRDLEQGNPGHKAENGPYRTDRIAPEPSPGK